MNSKTKNPRSPKTPVAKAASPLAIISQMKDLGAAFRFSPGGQMYVDGLSEISSEIRDMFLNHPQPSLLVAAVRELEAKTSDNNKSAPKTLARPGLVSKNEKSPANNRRSEKRAPAKKTNRTKSAPVVQKLASTKKNLPGKKIKRGSHSSSKEKVLVRSKLTRKKSRS